MNATERIKQTLYDFVSAGLFGKNFGSSFALLTDNFIGVGIGEKDFSFTKDNTIFPLSAGAASDDCASYELCYENFRINFPTDQSANACATFTIKKSGAKSTAHAKISQSLSLILRESDWYICAAHTSPIEISNKDLNTSPVYFAECEFEHVREEFEEEALELIYENLSGGIMGIYIDNDTYSLNFANNSILKLLGYSRKEFYDKYKDNALEMVFPEDRTLLITKVRESFEHTDDYHMDFRLIKNDGTPTWVVEHARNSHDKKGRPFILVVVTDINELVNMQESLKRKTSLLEAQAEELVSQNSELLSQRHELEAQTHALILSEERFRIALEKTSNIIFDYDILSGRILHSNLPESSGFMFNISEAKDGLLLGGKISDEYLSSFNAAVSLLHDGEPQVECVIKALLPGGKDTWSRISMTGIKDESGKTIRAIGLLEDITAQKNAELAFVREEQYRQAILGSAMASYVIDFTRDKFESCYVRDPRCANILPGEPYDNFMSQMATSRMSAQQRSAFINFFSKSNIMQAFDRGETELRLEYCILSYNGTTMWMENTIRLLEDSTTGNKLGYLYVADIDDKKHAELTLIHQAEYDALTGIFNKGATTQHIRDLISSSDVSQAGVFMMLDIDSFKNINDTYGHPFGDEVLSEAAKILYNNFREPDIVGRIGGDEFCVFSCEIIGKARVEAIAQRICEKIGSIRTPEEGKIGISCSIGISMCNGVSKSFETLYKEADTALYEVKDTGKNGYAFFDGERLEKGLKWVRHAEWILEKLDAAVYICDRQSYNMLYVNQRCLDLFHADRRTCFGKKCYEVLGRSKGPCSFCSMDRLSEEHSLDRIYNLPGTNELYLMRGQLVEWDGALAHLEMATNITGLAKDLMGQNADLYKPLPWQDK
ncbi:MAG: diguanylate cyclase [Oscillospiraceae bacterium]